LEELATNWVFLDELVADQEADFVILKIFVDSGVSRDL
jgi:hypothetical protein